MTDPSNPRFRIKPEHAAVIAVTLAPILYFLPALYYGHVLCPADGIIQNVPFRATLAHIVRSGHLPLWDPYIFGGMPLLAAAQPGVLFPLNWFYLLFNSASATNMMVISSYMVAGLGAFLYARGIGSSVAGAMMTALVWQFGGAAIGQLSHINIVQTSAMLPWVLWSIDAYAQIGSYKRGSLMAALIAIQFFAGHQQTFIYSLLLVGAYAITLAVTNLDLRKRYLSSLAFAATGLVLAAVQILPTFELLRNSYRAAASYDFFTSYSLPPRFVMALLAPYVMGGGDGRLFRAPYIGPPYYPEMIGYVGIIAIMLATLALLMNRDTRTKFWAVVFFVALFLAFGRFLPLHFYKLIYLAPMLNLFRVPARHLMEVDFALAVLAGRGLTALQTARQRNVGRLRVAIVGLTFFFLTVLTVTLLRPAAFHLGRDLPVAILRAPELFLPILIAGVSAWLLWSFARRRRGAIYLLFAVLVIDLAVWGQSSGWYTSSPASTEQFWRVPEAVQELRKIAPNDNSSYRILTVPYFFDPDRRVIPPGIPSPDLWTQPDVYMMHGIQNAAGYDGFGLDRYQRFAGQMKVWGELSYPDATLRGASREMDLLNVRYLIADRNAGEQTFTPARKATNFDDANQDFGGFKFAAHELGLPPITKDQRLAFEVPAVDIDRIGLITNLAWSEKIPDDVVVGRVRLKTSDGRQVDLPLHAGADTAEWSYDRADIRARIRHRRPTIATNFDVEDAGGHYQGHTYFSTLPCGEKLNVTGGEIVVAPNPRWPDLALSVFRISLIDSTSAQTYALRRDSITIDRLNVARPANPEAKNERWQLVGETPDVQIYENRSALPRAWMVSDIRVMNDNTALETIRSGKFADGTKWDPATAALIESALAETPQASSLQEAEITRYEPNRIDVATKSDANAILVLSENHYPGWRAYVDGQFIETLRVDYNLRGVPLPAGEHKIQFVYRPKSVLIGFAMSLLAFAGLVSWPLFQKKFIRKLHRFRR